MKDFKIILGGINLNPSKTENVKNAQTKSSVGLFGFGFKNNGAAPVETAQSASSTTIPPELNKFLSLEDPFKQFGKPSQLQIDDKYYMPDKPFAEAQFSD